MQKVGRYSGEKEEINGRGINICRSFRTETSTSHISNVNITSAHAMPMHIVQQDLYDYV